MTIMVREVAVKALVYHGPGQKSWDTVPDPSPAEPTNIVVQVDTTTICGTDLHILKGDVPAVVDGRVLGHEAVGTVVAVGSAVNSRAASSPTLACTGHPPRCIWKTCGSRTSRSPPAWSTAPPCRCCCSWSGRGRSRPTCSARMTSACTT